MEKTMREHMKNRFGGDANFSEKPPLPKSLNIELNTNCNQKCVFCPFHGEKAYQQLETTMMKYEDAVAILDQAHALGIGEKEVGFYMAGEAFIHKDLARVIQYAKDLGFQYTFLTTNGALATPDKMKEVLDAGLDSIRFSVNASDRESYAEIHGRDDYEQVLENIKYMAEYIKQNNLSVATSISCVITKQTLGIQDDVRKIFGQYVDDILFIPVLMNRLNFDADFIEKYKIMDDSRATINEEYVCPILYNTMYIGANMKVMPCCDAYDTNCFFYDLKQDFDLEKAWYSDGYRRYRDIFLKDADDKETLCERCMLRRKGVERLILE